MIDGRSYLGRRAGRLRLFGAVVLIAVGVTLAMVVGGRLSNEALSVLAGAACGVGAAIPTSLIILALSRRNSEDRDHRLRRAVPRPEQQVPVVVTSQPPPTRTAGVWGPLPGQMGAPTRRRFTVVGGSPFDQDVTIDEGTC